MNENSNPWGQFVRKDNFMSERRELLSICYHADDDTGLHRIGEIDFSINARLESYIEKYGYKGVEEILAMLGHLAWEVKDCFYKNFQKKSGLWVRPD